MEVSTRPKRNRTIPSRLRAVEEQKENTQHRNNYTLNQNQALQKKKDACDRDFLHMEIRRNNVVISLSTATFELAKQATIHYLNSNKGRKYELKQEADRKGSIAADVVRVLYKDSAAYTATFYRTTCRMLVNGPLLDIFINEDFPILKKHILKNMA